MSFFRIPSLRRSLQMRFGLRSIIAHRLGGKMPKGLGGVRNPHAAVRNHVYSRTTMSMWDGLKIIFRRKK